MSIFFLDFDLFRMFNCLYLGLKHFPPVIRCSKTPEKLKTISHRYAIFKSRTFLINLVVIVQLVYKGVESILFTWMVNDRVIAHENHHSGDTWSKTVKWEVHNTGLTVYLKILLKCKKFMRTTTKMCLILNILLSAYNNNFEISDNTFHVSILKLFNINTYDQFMMLHILFQHVNFQQFSIFN